MRKQPNGENVRTAGTIVKSGDLPARSVTKNMRHPQEVQFEKCKAMLKVLEDNPDQTIVARLVKMLKSQIRRGEGKR